MEFWIVIYLYGFAVTFHGTNKVHKQRKGVVSSTKPPWYWPWYKAIFWWFFVPSRIVTKLYL